MVQEILLDVGPELPHPATEAVRIGRRPILDRQQSVFGYQLLYEATDESAAGTITDERAAARNLLGTFLEIGPERIAGQHAVVIRMPASLLTARLLAPFDPARLILELAGETDVSGQLIEGVTFLNASGYRIAVDDYRFDPKWEPLLPTLSLLKIDCRTLDVERHSPDLDRLRQHGLTLVATQVETLAEFGRFRALGFDLFQGYFFARPHVVSGAPPGQNQLVLMRLLEKLSDARCEIDSLSRLIEQDPVLSYRILRYLNSAAMGLRRQVDSIHAAVVYVGLERIRNLAMLYAMAGFEGKSAELLHTGLVRAALCRSLSEETGTGQPETAYTTGLLSVLDALLDQPMPSLLEQMPLSADITSTLLSQSGPYGSFLSCVLALERGDWLHPSLQMLPVMQMNNLFLDAMIQAESAQQAMEPDMRCQGAYKRAAQ